MAKFIIDAPPPARNQRVSVEQIVAAYERTGSIWKTAKELGICGQSAWERLKALNYPMVNRWWTAEEKAELRALVDHCTLSEIALRLGRPYYGVALMASRLGIVTRYGNRIKRKVPRGAGFTKERVRGLIRDLEQFKGSLRQFCRMEGFSLDTLALAIQTHEPAWWDTVAQARGFAAKTCPNCGREFFPMSNKQRTCSRRCNAHHAKNQSYFGGRRQEAIGMAEGVCQLCFRQVERGLSAHHMLGKEHDPENAALIALCPGCHKIVEQLATRAFADTAHGWERLIELVMARRLPKQLPRDGQKLMGTHCYVEIEFLTEDEWCEQYPEGGTDSEVA